MKLYEKINEEEILCKNLKLPKCFPEIYIDEYDNVFCYIGVVDKDRISLNSSPYYLQEKKSSEAKKYIRGYFKIQNGEIVIDNKFIDEKNSFNDDAKCKIISANVHFPTPNDMSFAIYCNKYPELDDEITRKVFGLTYKETKELLIHFNDIFQISKTNSFYNKYPSITRSISSDNFCDISDLWIPKGYPYISFNESDYIYSHVSLYSFYNTIKFITNYSLESPISKKLLELGLNKNILENLFKFDNDIFSNIKITKSYYYKLLDETEENQK